MNIIKKLTAILSVALVTGLGIFSVSSVINAQSQKENPQQQENRREERQDKKGEIEKNAKSEKSETGDNDGEETGDNEPEESEADEQAEQAALAGQATVPKEQAQATALQQVAGKIVKSELEDEDGKIVYGFEIRDGNGKVFDVKIDAKTGAFVKASSEDDEEKGETSEKGEEHETEND